VQIYFQTAAGNERYSLTSLSKLRNHLTLAVAAWAFSKKLAGFCELERCPAKKYNRKLVSSTTKCEQDGL